MIYAHYKIIATVKLIKYSSLLLVTFFSDQRIQIYHPSKLQVYNTVSLQPHCCTLDFWNIFIPQNWNCTSNQHLPICAPSSPWQPCFCSLLLSLTTLSSIYRGILIKRHNREGKLPQRKSRSQILDVFVSCSNELEGNIYSKYIIILNKSTIITVSP